MKILRLLAAAFVVSAGFSGAAVGQARLQLIDPPSAARAAPEASEKSAAPPERGQLRSRDAHPNWDALNQLRKLLRANPGVAVEIELPVFADMTLVLSINRIEDQGRGVTSFSGHVVGEPLSSALIVDAHGTFAAHVNRDNKAYQVTFRGGAHAAAEIDRSAFDGPDEPRVPRKVRPATAKAAEVVAAADDGSTIDVMVVYSPLARSTAGGTAAIQNQIALALASTNQAYAASGMVQRVRLVHTAEVNYVEPASPDIIAALDLITDGLAPFGGVNALRTQYGADIVSLFVERGGPYCGVGWLMHEIGSWFAPNAYNVTVRTCATTGSTFSHEMGHNMGLEHDIYVSPIGPDHPTAQPYAHGYVNTAARFRTIMAYQDACNAAGVSCVRINQFSSPTHTYSGVATGTTTIANAARMLDETRVTVANFRAATVADIPSTVSFALASYSVTEGGVALSAVVTRTGTATSAASVTWTTANGTAISGQDFGIAGNSSQRTGTISWAAGESGSKTIALAVLDDSALESSEAFTIGLTNPVGAVLGAITTTTVTIADNESVFNVQAAPLAVNENGPNVAFRVTRTGSIASAVNVTYRTTNGTAIAGTDFGTLGSTVQPAAVLTFAANQAFRDIVIGPTSVAGAYIRVLNDALVEPDKTFTITLSAPTAGGLIGAAPSAVVTIINDDAPAAPGPNTLTFPAATATVSEGAANLVLSVRRAGTLGGTAVVTWTAANGAALAGTDFGIAGNATPPSGTLSWTAGDAVAKNITLPILNDAFPEGAKTFTVALSDPVGTGVSIGAISQVSVTLTDNDAGVVLGAPTYSVAENGLSATLTVQRVGSAALAASVRWATANGTATAGQDFGTNGSAVQRSGIVSWLAGDAAAKSIVIPILNDTLNEGAETFTVALNTPSAGILIGTPGSATVTIVDDDSPPATELRFAQPKYLVIEGGGNAVLTVNRVDAGGGFGTSASVRYATLAGTALATSDFTAVSGTLTWPAGDSSPKTITVPIVNNAIAESPEAFKVLLSAPSPGTGVATPEASVTILDDDEVFPPDGAIPEGWVTPAAASAGWLVSNDPGSYEGVFSLRSDSIDDGESAQIEVTRAFSAGSITFRLKVSSEAGFDTLRFFVDGVEKGSWSGTAVPGWQLFSMPIAAGTHTLRWSYEKDGSASVGQDAAWIDGVSFP